MSDIRPKVIGASALLLLGMLLASGCATVTTQPSQSFTVSTDPSGAQCTLSRQDKVLAVVNPTPGTVRIDKGGGGLYVACKREGYLDASAQAAAQFQDMTLGNILIGGLIGLAVDAASGAMYFYPSSVTVVLIPAGFGTMQERDAFFDRLESRVREGAAKSLDQLQKKCQQPDKCARDRRAIESARDEQLKDFERQRAAAVIGIATAAAPLPPTGETTGASLAADPLSRAVRYVDDHACQGPLQPLGMDGSFTLYHAKCGDRSVSLRCTAQGCEELFTLPAR